MSASYGSALGLDARNCIGKSVAKLGLSHTHYTKLVDSLARVKDGLASDFADELNIGNARRIPVSVSVAPYFAKGRPVGAVVFTRCRARDIPKNEDYHLRMEFLARYGDRIAGGVLRDRLKGSPPSARNRAVTGIEFDLVHGPLCALNLPPARLWCNRNVTAVSYRWMVERPKPQCPKRSIGAMKKNGAEGHQSWIDAEIEDTLDEELELEIDDAGISKELRAIYGAHRTSTMDRRVYFRELLRLQSELIRLQDWVAHTRAKVVVLFEGRDAAGKGGAIKRISQRLNPRTCRVVALPAPTDREKTQWYFQRYVPHLPAGGEIVLFDRSWYNRAGVERVMGFATPEEVEQFFHDVPEFERMLVRSGITLIKYWFSITDQEQQLRFQMRIHDPMKQWKLSPMDLQSRVRWEYYTKVKEEMFDRTNIAESPWFIVEGNDKKRARLNCMSHFLDQIPYEAVPHTPITLPERMFNPDYERKVLPTELYVPDIY